MTEFLTQDTFKVGLVSQGTTTVPNPVAGTDAMNKTTADATYLKKVNLVSDGSFTIANSTTQYLGQWDISNDLSSSGGWPDRLQFRYEGSPGVFSRTGGFNEYGEIRADAAKSTTVAMRAHGHLNGATPDSTVNIFEVAAARGGATLFGVSRTAITALQPVTLPADPTTGLQAATKQYVDSKAGLTQTTADARYLQLTGGTLSNSLHVNALPSNEGKIYFESSGVTRWTIGKSGTSESGGNTGSDLSIVAYGDGGASIGEIIRIRREYMVPEFNTGAFLNYQRIVYMGDPVDPADAATKQYVDARTPKVTVASTAPSTPAVGDIWVDSS